MSGLNLMVDIDEVLFPLIDEIHALAQARGLHDGSVGAEWRGWEVYGCSEEAYWDIWAEFSESGLYVSTKPIPGALEALRHLYLDGHRVNLVTARGQLARGDDIKRWTREWIEEFAVPHHTLTFSSDKVADQAVLGRYDLAIDDSPSNYRALEDDGVNVWMMTHHHNRDYEGAARVDDMWSWVQVAERLG